MIVIMIIIIVVMIMIIMIIIVTIIKHLPAVPSIAYFIYLVHLLFQMLTGCLHEIFEAEPNFLKCDYMLHASGRKVARQNSTNKEDFRRKTLTLFRRMSVEGMDHRGVGGGGTNTALLHRAASLCSNGSMGPVNIGIDLDAVEREKTKCRQALQT